jgi:hypothetical protein
LASDATLDLSHGIFHLRKAKLEPGGEQPPGHDAATLEDQFGLGPASVAPGKVYLFAHTSYAQVVPSAPTPTAT